MLGKAIDTLSSLRHVNLNPLSSTFPTWRKVANIAALVFVAVACFIYIGIRHGRQIKAQDAELAKTIIESTVNEIQNFLKANPSSSASNLLNSEVIKLHQQAKNSGMDLKKTADVQPLCNTLKVLFTLVYTKLDQEQADPQQSALLIKFFANLYHALRQGAKLEVDNQGRFTIKNIPSQTSVSSAIPFYNQKHQHYTCRILFNGLVQKLSEKKQIQEFGGLLKDPRFVLDENLHYRPSQKLFEEDLSSLFEFLSAPPATQQPSLPPSSSSSATSSSSSSASSSSSEASKLTAREKLAQMQEKISQAIDSKQIDLPKSLSNDGVQYMLNTIVSFRTQIMSEAMELNQSLPTEQKIPLTGTDRFYIVSKTRIEKLFNYVHTQPSSADTLRNEIINCLNGIYLCLIEFDRNQNNLNPDHLKKTAILFAKIYHAFRQNATLSWNGNQLSFTAPESLADDHSDKFYKDLPEEFKDNHHSHARALFNHMIIELDKYKNKPEIADLLKNPLFQQDLQGSYCNPKI